MATRLPLTALAAALAVALAAAPALAASCVPPAGFEPHARLESAGVVLFFRIVPAPVEVGRHFALETVVCAAPAPHGLRVSADMPEHRHGMNYRVETSAAPDGRFVSEGFLFHMPGRWRLVFEVARDGRTERLTADLAVE